MASGITGLPSASSCNGGITFFVGWFLPPFFGLGGGSPSENTCTSFNTKIFKRSNMKYNSESYVRL